MPGKVNKVQDFFKSSCNWHLLFYSFISGITLLGNPTEMYIYGTQYIFVIVGVFMTPWVAGKVFLPVFHDMKLSSTYEVKIYEAMKKHLFTAIMSE